MYPLPNPTVFTSKFSSIATTPPLSCPPAAIIVVGLLTVFIAHLLTAAGSSTVPVHAVSTSIESLCPDRSIIERAGNWPGEGRSDTSLPSEDGAEGMEDPELRECNSIGAETASVGAAALSFPTREITMGARRDTNSLLSNISPVDSPTVSAKFVSLRRRKPFSTSSAARRLPSSDGIDKTAERTASSTEGSAVERMVRDGWRQRLETEKNLSS
mmetsp:Transcript_25264/g.58362  ORF Transcript_25264/g.58362 Transcript_25264/m.58362 type:complete len:214 (+) Transcript_25264:991-1632(+)